jgi:hypothetical protein
MLNGRNAMKTLTAASAASAPPVRARGLIEN